MELIIHRGSKEIGGNCIELIHNGKSILLDFGMPLNPEDVNIPDTLDAERITAIIVSHTHQDHIGLADILPDIPVYIGEGALRMVREASVWIDNSVRLPNALVFNPYEPFVVAGFTITPYPVDHSAFDSYALLIEAGGKRVFYSGDFRNNGYAAYKTEKLINNPPTDIDVLLMEGTTVGSSTHDNLKETSLIEKMVKAVDKNTGLVMLAASSQNIDRMVTAYKAANKLKREFVVDAYAYSMLKTTGIPSILGALSKMKVFIPQRQRVKIKNEQLFDRLCPYNQRIYLENIAEAPYKYIVLYRRAHNYAFTADMLKDSIMLYSMWSGYLTGDSSIETFVKHNGIEMRHVHTSGHADLPTLQKLAKALKPKVLIPVHSEKPELYSEYFENVNMTKEIEI